MFLKSKDFDCPGWPRAAGMEKLAKKRALIHWAYFDLGRNKRMILRLGNPEFFVPFFLSFKKRTLIHWAYSDLGRNKRMILW